MFLFFKLKLLYLLFEHVAYSFDRSLYPEWFADDLLNLFDAYHHFLIDFKFFKRSAFFYEKKDEDPKG